MRVVYRLCGPLALPEPEEIPEAGLSFGAHELLSRRDEALVAELRKALARLAAGLGGSATGPDPAGAVRATLDSAEMLIRGELIRGNEAGLAKLMPSFVYLVALPLVGQDRALRLSERTEALVDEELRR